MTKTPKITDRAAFAAMWGRGVTGGKIAKHFGVPTWNVYATAARFDLPKRSDQRVVATPFKVDRLPWGDAWMDRSETPYFAQQCRKLWAAVLWQGIRDAYCDGTHGFRWIGSRDFREVCAHAGFNGERVAACVAAQWDDPDFAIALRVKPRVEKEAAHV